MLILLFLCDRCRIYMIFGRKISPEHKMPSWRMQQTCTSKWWREPETFQNSFWRQINTWTWLKIENLSGLTLIYERASVENIGQRRSGRRWLRQTKVIISSQKNRDITRHTGGSVSTKINEKRLWVLHPCQRVCVNAFSNNMLLLI